MPPGEQPSGTEYENDDKDVSQAQCDTGNGQAPHPLRAALDELGGNLDDWTVLAPQRDPFRFDIPANHRNGRWLADRK